MNQAAGVAVNAAAAAVQPLLLLLGQVGSHWLVLDHLVKFDQAAVMPD
jgi:hypothetical protein